MSALDNNILKELDRQRIDGKSISIIMKKLINVEMKTKFLNYLIDNRNILLMNNNILEYIRKDL